MFFILNKKTKEEVHREYGVLSQEFMWNSPKVLRKLNSIKKEKMTKYLKDELNITEVKDIRKLSKQATEEAVTMKTKFPLIPSFFAALFLSVWNSFFNWLYSIEIIQSVDIALIILRNALFLIAILSISFLYISRGFASILNDIFNRDSKLMRVLSKLLDEIADDLERSTEINKS